MSIEVEEYNPTAIDDTSAVNTDVNKLYINVIKKIDAIRSSTNLVVGLGITANQARTEQNPLEDTIERLNAEKEVNPVRFTESRAHAFYRALGFPTAASDGTFYSSGYNPRNSTSDQLNDVDKRLFSNEALKNLLLKRETDPHDRRKIFANQDVNSIAYALAMRHLLPFNLIDSNNIDPFYADPQTIQMFARDWEMGYYSGYVANRVISLPGKLTIASNPSHILKPFIVSPVEKGLPTTKRVAAPFMPSDKDLVVDKSKQPLHRPEIEYIIRRRLQNIEFDSIFFENAQRLLGNPNSQTTEEIRSVVLALSGADNIGLAAKNSELLNVVRGLTTTQMLVINKFVREIKGLVARLNQATREIDFYKQRIIWQPVPDKEGPEFLGKSKVGGDGSATSKVTQQIATLSLLQLEQQTNALNSENYTLALDIDTQVNYDQQIALLKGEQDKMGSLAMQRLREIEIITGEVSGLGLIDVLAINTALWAIDIETLLGFLDGEAFDRLYTFNKDLRVPQVNQRKTAKTTPLMSETLQTFEQQVARVLSFAQGEVERNKKNPRQVPSSNVR